MSTHFISLCRCLHIVKTMGSLYDIFLCVMITEPHRTTRRIGQFTFEAWPANDENTTINMEGNHYECRLSLANEATRAKCDKQKELIHCYVIIVCISNAYFIFYFVCVCVCAHLLFIIRLCWRRKYGKEAVASFCVIHDIGKLNSTQIYIHTTFENH